MVDNASVNPESAPFQPAPENRVDNLPNTAAVRRDVIQGAKPFQCTLDTPDGHETIDCGETGFDVAVTYKTAMLEFLSALEQATPTSQPLEEGLMSSELAIRIKEQACLNP